MLIDLLLGRCLNLSAKVLQSSRTLFVRIPGDPPQPFCRDCSVNMPNNECAESWVRRDHGFQLLNSAPVICEQKRV